MAGFGALIGNKPWARKKPAKSGETGRALKTEL